MPSARPRLHLLLSGAVFLSTAAAAMAAESNGTATSSSQSLAMSITTLLCIVAAGLIIGQVRLWGISLGASGVLFVALWAGHLGHQVPPAIGTLGLILFVYCVGIDAGPNFMRVLTSQGKSLVLLSAGLFFSAATAAWAMGRLLTLPADLVSGIFAGCMTSTPGLAAAIEHLDDPTQVAVGFGVGYPFGVIGMVLFVQLLPKFLPVRAEDTLEEQRASREFEIVRALVEIANPVLVGKRLSAVAAIADSQCQVSRIVRDEQLQPIPAEFELQLGQCLLIVGKPNEVARLVDSLGEQVELPGLLLDTENQRRTVVVSASEVVGRSLRELKLLSRFGVTIARIRRHDFVFVPSARTRIQFGDVLSTVGQPEDTERFAAFAGHRPRLADQTDLISLAVGLLLGVLLGSISVQLAGGSFALGLAGGPLLAGLLLGHFGSLGPIVGHFPRASRMLMTQAGLSLFLAAAGTVAGRSLVPVLGQHGLVLCATALVITAAPLVVGWLLARVVLRMGRWQMLGGVCGGMTSTPGLGLLNAQTESSVPVASYAAAYPLALVLITLLTPTLIRLLGG